MLSKRVNRFVYVVALVLMLGASMFAVTRSRSIAAPEEALPQSQAAGRGTYEAECSGCHPGGANLTRAVSSAASPEGRRRLLDLIIAGSEEHPQYAHLSDEEIAATLNYALTEWSSDRTIEPFDAGEVAAAR